MNAHGHLFRIAIGLLLSTIAATLRGAPPTISFQPKDQKVILYQPATFGVIANGTAPLSYQWRKDGVPIAGATNDQIALPQPRFSDAGRYSVVVSNAEGSTTSADAVLTVNSPKGGDLDYSFVWGGWSGPRDDIIRSIVVQPDGKIVLAGEFARTNGIYHGGITRLNSDGTTDYTFVSGNSGPNGPIHTVAVQRDGKILIGGDFTSVDGASRTNIARLHRNGALDTSFQASGVSYPIILFAVRTDSRVVIMGGFTNIALLNAEGSLDTNFQSGLSGFEDASAIAPLAMQADDKMLITGTFPPVNGVSRSLIRRLNPDGSVDSGFQAEVYSGNCCAAIFVRAVAQSDGKVILGGSFTAINGVGRTNIARLNSDGSLDGSFESEIRAYEVRSVAVQSDGKVVLGGFFSVGGVIARLNSSGTLDSVFSQNGLSITLDEVNSVALQSDGKVLAGGIGWRSKPITRLNADGTLDNSFAGFQNNFSGTDRPVKTVAAQGDGKVLIGGWFSTVNGVSRDNLARLNADGTLDGIFQNGFPGAGYEVSSIVVQSGGKLLVGSGNLVSRLNADGTLDTSFRTGRFELGGNGSTVFSVAVQDDGKIVAGGQFDTVNGVSRNSVTRLNADGNLDSGFQSGLRFGDIVFSVAVQSDGKVLIGGFFTSINGVSRNGIARLHADGTLDNAFQNGLSGLDGQVNSVAVQSDGKVLIGGAFNTVNGVSRTNIARLNGDGTLDSSFQNGLSGVDRPPFSIAVQSDGKVLIGGLFTKVHGVSRNGIARLNSDGTLDTSFQDGLSGAYGPALGDMDSPGPHVYSLAIQADGKVLLVGGFTTVNGVPARRIARLWGSQPSHIESITRPDAESAMLTLRLPAGTTNRVQYKDELTDAVWLDLPGDVIVSDANSSTNKLDTTAGTAQRRFYRVKQIP